MLGQTSPASSDLLERGEDVLRVAAGKPFIY